MHLPMRITQILGILATVFLFLLLWMQIPLFYLNLSPSLPRGLYLRIPKNDIAIGDYVAYLPSEDVVAVMQACEWISDDRPLKPFLKRVGALSGDRYTVSNKSFFINGEYIGEALPEDSEGHALPLASGAHIVPEGEFLPISDFPRSFDGRYTGSVSLNRIVARVIPILVVDGFAD